ncbi:mucin-2-like isoform X1 [Pungitius pungitius]|uniref:mucin-2-like isoform X1 n=1 Tax=Pungitius pungitius TaxID=134920 RepID=UPI002E0F68F8
MELPLGGPALRHYTHSRPRPHRQKLNYRPSKPQETIIESDNEVLELMGRVDEGVEEFFTKRVLPTDTPENQDEESITVHEVAPASSVPCAPPTKTLRRKLGDFFTLKKRRGLKSETSQDGRPKKTSIADLIRPLREVTRAEKEKDKDRVKEHDKENEKEKAKEHPGAVSGESAVQETPGAQLRGEVVPPRRALREGKSQSLILLSGSAAAGTANARNTSKKQLEGQHSFEQKLHLMLQRIGVSKAQPGGTQNQEGEMKKAESEGTIIDSKPEPPPTFTKPRTMSASSDTRHQIRPSVSAHESAGKPALLPKPVIKPGPPRSTSGRNTPENELARIQEGESNTPTKVSPAAASSTPAAPTLDAPTTPTVPTVAKSVTDSTPSTSTVPLSDTDMGTNSVDPSVAATTPTNVTEPDSKPPVLEANSTTPELPTSTFPTTLSNTTTPTEPPATVSVTYASSESIAPSLSVASTLETISAPGHESSVPTLATNLSTKLTFPKSNGVVLVDAAPDACGDAAISAITTASSPSTSISEMPPCVSSTATSVTEGRKDATSVSSSVTLVTETTSPPPNSSPYITTVVSPVASITSSSILTPSALPTNISTSSITITSPASTDCLNSLSTSTIPHPASPSPAEISVPSTSSSETNPTDTTSTATSLYRADTTSTTSSANAAAICSPLMTDADPLFTYDANTTLTPTVDNLSAAAHHLTSPAISSDNTNQDLQTSPEERPSVEPAENGTADEKLKMVQKTKQSEMNECKKVVDGGKENKNKDEIVALTANTEVMLQEEQDESVTPEEDIIKSEVGMVEPASGKDGELCRNKEEIDGQKQDQGEE